MAPPTNTTRMCKCWNSKTLLRDGNLQQRVLSWQASAMLKETHAKKTKQVYTHEFCLLVTLRSFRNRFEFKLFYHTEIPKTGRGAWKFRPVPMRINTWSVFKCRLKAEEVFIGIKILNWLIFISGFFPFWQLTKYQTWDFIFKTFHHFLTFIN